MLWVFGFLLNTLKTVTIVRTVKTLLSWKILRLLLEIQTLE